MSLLKYLWGFFFRLFPCPTRVGLHRTGKPGPDSPVLVTCNFYLTVRRLKRAIRGLDLWLLVGDSKGVNVWCAAGGEEFNTHSVVSVVKTSEIAERVNHRTLILPPLAAPGVKAAEVKAQTGWKVKWGPVRAEDIPSYMKNDLKRTEQMKRVTYRLKERLDTALGSLFPFYFLGGIGFLLFGPHLLLDYLVVGAVGFVVFMWLCPWIPGARGMTKAIFCNAILMGGLLISELFPVSGSYPVRSHLIIAMVMILIYGLELGGITSTMASDLDPFLARLGVKAIGNVAFAGTIRTELLNGDRKLSYDRSRCKTCRSCEEVCPQGVWSMDESRRAVLAFEKKCTACRACLMQCEGGAIQALRVQP